MKGSTEACLPSAGIIPGRAIRPSKSAFEGLMALPGIMPEDAVEVLHPECTFLYFRFVRAMPARSIGDDQSVSLQIES